MKKAFVTAFVLIAVLICGRAHAQTRTVWQFVKAFPDTGFKGNLGCHGLAVDPEGKIWIQRFNASDSIVDATSGRKRAIRVIYVYRPDGTAAPFSPIRTITVAGKTDTLYNRNNGLRTDHQGNILVANNDVLFRLNYRTGAGMNRTVPQPGGGNPAILTAPAVDAQGNIFTAQVFPGTPIRVFDKDFNLTNNVLDTSRGFSRTFEVAKDGKTLYWTGYTNNAIYKYTRATEFDPFTVKPDTILKGFACESATFHPKTGHLWLSAGSSVNRPNQFVGARTSYSINTWYAYNTATNQVVDSLKWVFQVAGTDERPRALAFSAGGDTAYVGCFNNSTYPPVQMFVRRATKVEDQPGRAVTVEGYALSQNYPNPFNPTTEIKFAIAKTGLTTIKIYNVLGKEVATLLNDNLFVGNHSVKFDASDLPSGTYIYELRSGGVRLTRKMVLMK